MKIGVHVMNFTLPDVPGSLADTVAGTVTAAEDIGAEWVTFMDHWFQMEFFGKSEDPMLEGYTALGYAAALTSRVKLGLLVTGVTYRHPGLLAKTVTTLDVLSKGRGMLGIGAAWYEREHLALGVPFPPLKERFERLEETLQICHQMWTDDNGSYDGVHYHLAETICSPPPVSSPRPTILIGGSGEKKTLKFVAKYADACNLMPIGVDGVRHKLDVLRGHCEDAGRDFSELTLTMMAPQSYRTGDNAAFIAECADYAELDIELLTMAPVSNDPVSEVKGWGDEIVPALSRL